MINVLNKKKILAVIVYCLFFLFNTYSQAWFYPLTTNSPNRCAGGSMVDFTDQEKNINFVFDSFAKWRGGITIYSGTTIKVIAIQDTTINSPPVADPPCYWKLRMQIDNLGAPSDEWDTEFSYGSGNGDKPTVDFLEVRVDNGCHTPIVTTWQTFSSGNLDIKNIINPDPGSEVDNGIGISACSSENSGETNGAGTYLGIDYQEFTFSVDYKFTPDIGVSPGMAPGLYRCVIHFCLQEQ
jgi:hypothetical protein